MHKVYWETMDGDPNQFYLTIDEALDRIANTPNCLYWAPKINIIEHLDKFESLKIDEQRTSMTGEAKMPEKRITMYRGNHQH